jgi:hypothetical protein
MAMGNRRACQHRRRRWWAPSGATGVGDDLEITWALVLGFTLSAIVESVVSQRQMARLLADDRSRTLAIACGWGGVQLLLVCGGGAGPGDLPQGRQLHRRELERILRIPGPEP